MRTTVTLDEDVAQRIRQLMRERGVGFKRVLNDVLRRGLHSTAEIEPYSTPVFELGVRPEVDLDRAMALVGALEDEEARRKLDLAK